MAAGLAIVLCAGFWSIITLARFFAPGVPFFTPGLDIFGSISKVFLPGIMPIFIGVAIYIYGRRLYSPAKNAVRAGSILDTGSVGLLTWFFGGLLMAAGVLIMLTAGVCSFAVLADVAMSTGSNVTQTMIVFIPIVLYSGGIPIGIGAGLFFCARVLYRSTWTQL
jgi:hypothetical protein